MITRKMMVSLTLIGKKTEVALEEEITDSLKKYLFSTVVLSTVLYLCWALGHGYDTIHFLKELQVFTLFIIQLTFFKALC